MTIYAEMYIINFVLGEWAYSSAVEQPAHNRLAPGSIPGRPTIKNKESESFPFLLLSVNYNFIN